MPGRARTINIWVLLGALVVASLLTMFTLGLLWLTRSSGGPNAPSTAILYVIPAPPATSTPEESTPLPGALPSPPAGSITVGAYVEITGTAGEGLRLRDLPGLDGKLLLLGSEAEIFRVADGPKDADGYTWWYLTGPFDDTRKGWAVSNYLQVVQKP
jgi:hypothetical protein